MLLSKVWIIASMSSTLLAWRVVTVFFRLALFDYVVHGSYLLITPHGFEAAPLFQDDKFLVKGCH